MKTPHQRGMAAIVTVALIAIGALGIARSGILSIQAAQNQQITMNATSQSKRRAIRGAEILHQYLNSLKTADIEKLQTGNLPISGEEGISAELVSNKKLNDKNPNSPRQLVINITGRSAQTSSTFQVVYENSLPSNNGSGNSNAPTSTGTINIRSNFEINGDFRVIKGSSAQFMVEGDAKINGSADKEELIESVCASGNITISGGNTVSRVCARGKVTLEGSAKVVTDISAIGDVNLLGGQTSAGIINTNSNVTISNGSAAVATVNAKGNVTLEGGSSVVSNTINAEGAVLWNSSNSTRLINANGNVTYEGGNNTTTINTGGTATLSGNGKVQNLNAIGNVNLLGSYSGTGVIGNLRTEGNLKVNGNKYSGPIIGNGIVKGSISGEIYSASKVSRDPNLTINYTPVSLKPVDPVITTAPRIDVATLKDSANYVFEIVNQKKKVTVKNITGIKDGTYFLGSYPSSPHKDYLCTAVDQNGACTAPSQPYKTICQGHSEYNECFSFQNNEWKISGQTMAPGVAWFDNNLMIHNGVYLNTFLALGDIETQGKTTVISPNYAGYFTCTNDRSAWPYGFALPSGIAGIFPSDLCVGNRYEPSALANAALIAGGYSSSIYQGGEIDLGSSTDVYGSIFAGGTMRTSGNMFISGSVQVSNMKNQKDVATKWEGSTKIDLSNLPSTFNPGVVPCMNSAGCGAPVSGMRMRWTRFL